LTAAAALTVPDGAKFSRRMPPAPPEVIVAPVTRLSLSIAAKAPDALSPYGRSRLAGQVATIGSAIGPTGPPQTLAGLSLLRGVTVPAVKSPWLESVSSQPLLLRETEVLFDGAGVGPAPS
jgi:hypothetical protein